jgi:hypothetical protein
MRIENTLFTECEQDVNSLQKVYFLFTKYPLLVQSEICFFPIDVSEKPALRQRSRTFQP